MTLKFQKDKPGNLDNHLAHTKNLYKPNQNSNVYRQSRQTVRNHENGTELNGFQKNNGFGRSYRFWNGLRGSKTVTVRTVFKGKLFEILEEVN